MTYKAFHLIDIIKDMNFLLNIVSSMNTKEIFKTLVIMYN